MHCVSGRQLRSHSEVTATQGSPHKPSCLSRGTLWRIQHGSSSWNCTHAAAVIAKKGIASQSGQFHTQHASCAQGCWWCQPLRANNAGDRYRSRAARATVTGQARKERQATSHAKTRYTSNGLITCEHLLHQQWPLHADPDRWGCGRVLAWEPVSKPGGAAQV
jgi:hypothetical protein